MRFNTSTVRLGAKHKTFLGPLLPPSEKHYMETKSFASKQQELKMLRIIPREGTVEPVKFE